MALDGLLALVCAGAVMTAGPSSSGPPAVGDSQDSAVSTTLAVQTAMQQGRQHLLHNEYRAAVTALESQLPYINGNQVYLKLLEDAYRRYIQDLRLKKQDSEAERYLRRLIILDRGAILDKAIAGSKVVPPVSPDASTLKSVAPMPAKPAATVRLKSEDEDPFQDKQALTKEDDRAHQLLARAEQEFGNRHFPEARLLYEQAHEADHSATVPCRERWAYCKLFCVVEQLKHTDGANPCWPELEHEVSRALDLAPRLEYGKYLLAEIQKRRTPGSTLERNGAEVAVSVRHVTGRNDGWCLAESANFRIFHNQPHEFVDKVAQIAERTRTRLQQKWLGAATESWSPKCDLFLHATAEDYSRATGQYNSPGHSVLKMENGRLVVRRIDLHCDDANLLTAILPHETTHVALAGEFGPQLLPRWADEGMAVLTEPRERIERHLNNLLRCRQAGQFFRLEELVQFEEQYPKDPRYITAFYAQSVALVEFLTNQRGPQVFTQFLHDGMRYGYEKALERNYGCRSFADLESLWAQRAFRERASLASLANGSP
jgi:tetratricopeptide (TPR) repeat protein